MEYKSLILRVVLGLAGAIVLLGALWGASKLFAPAPAPARETPTGNAGAYTVDASYKAPTTIAVYHRVQDGLQVYEGALPITGCASISTGLSMTDADPPELAIALKVVVIGTGCVRPATEQPFSVTAGSINAKLGAVTVNGAPQKFLVEEK